METRLQPFTSPNGEVGYLVQGYDADTATYVMEDALLTSERWIANKVEMVPGKGVPAFAMRTMQLMRGFGVPAGSLRQLKVWGNHHVESVLQLARAERAGTPLEDAVRSTRAFESISTPITQSRHRIIAVRVHGGRRAPLSELLRWHEHRIMPLEGMTRPDRSAEHAAVLEREGAAPTDTVLFDYDLDIELAPY